MLQENKKIFQLAIASDWDYDLDFVNFLEESGHKHKLTTFVIWRGNLEDSYQQLLNGWMEFKFLFDRASDTSPEFQKIQKLVITNSARVLEPLESLAWASDKATMHLEFISNGLYTPYTIILPPYETHENCYLSVDELAKLGRTFIIKPANTTGGGIGVVDGAETLQDVLKARQSHHKDKYLLQEKVQPLERDGYRFWFRGFYACGLVQCSWWNNQTHLYRILTREEIRKYKLKPLFEIVEKIAQVSKLFFFSTEIALTENGQFIVVDYVNESCDMRLQSKALDGVPDQIVKNSADYIIRYVKKQLESPTPQL